MARYADAAQDNRPAGHADDEEPAESTASLASQVRELRAALDRQQEMIARQEELLRLERAARARQDEIIARLQGITPRETQTAKTRQAANATTSRTRRRSGPADATSPSEKRGRRALLKGAGVVAAAATVALVASEGQGAHAAGMTDGQPLVVGQDNSTSGLTSLTANSGSSPATLFQVDATNSTVSHGSIAIYGRAAQPGVSGANSVGVYGNADGGTGVYGVSFGQSGVKGYSPSATGVFGYSGSGGGVLGGSSTGTAVSGYSDSSLDMYAGGTGRIGQNLQGTASAPTYSASAGEMVRDAAGDMWLCVATGNPATWVKVAHLAPGATLGGATTYLPHPVRLLDTRTNASDAAFYGGGPLTNQQPNPSYTLQVAGVSYSFVTVPMGAVGAIGNVTVVASSGGPGYVSLVPHGAGFQNTSNINYTPNQTIANCFIVGLSPDGKLDIYVGGASTDVIIDIFAVVS